MANTAKRRWSRELESEVDGAAFGSSGPVLLHGYDPPAGGKWVDDVIPGKLGAYDRSTGEVLWHVPCEVGYGRGFGAGVGPTGQVMVLGPTQGGHRIVRQSMTDGELLETADIPAFDGAVVTAERVICVSAGRVFSLDTSDLSESWSYSREGERYHSVVLTGDRAIVIFSTKQGQGVLALDAETGASEGILMTPAEPCIQALVTTSDVLILLTSDLDRVLPPESIGDYVESLMAHEEGGATDTLSLLALRADGKAGDKPLWLSVLETTRLDDLPSASITADGGKLYLERGAHLQALDALTGRPLGEWTVPGLDEQIAWSVVDGAGLLAEETRVSVFELPA
ncbi:MAG: hypothetical protein ACI8QC_002285 [Planctomycetota bacterium]|jgi:hypothetical protein